MRMWGKDWKGGQGPQSQTAFCVCATPRLGVRALPSNNVTQNRLISRGRIQCIPGMGMWMPGWTEAEDSLKMSHTSKTPGSERVYGVEGPSLPPSLPLYLAVYRQHADMSVRQRTCSFSPGPDAGEEPRKSRETQFRHTSFEDLKTTGRYWWTLGESSGQKVQPACHTGYSVYILYRLYILYIEYEISLGYII